MTIDHSRLDGRIAIVTGGTQGLGATIARLFAERGVNGLVICGRNEQKGKAKADEIAAATGAKVVYVKADLEQVDDAKNVVHVCDQTFGRVDALVNAAAITDRGTILDTSPELFDAMFAVNVRAPFFLIQETVKVMRREKIEGTIVNIGSMSAKAGQPFIAAYCASKGALETRRRTRPTRCCATASASTGSTSAGWHPRVRIAFSGSFTAHQPTGWKRRPSASRSAASSIPRKWRAPAPIFPQRSRAS